MNFRGGTRRRRVEALIDITPLVDVVFQLIIFLLISTTFKTKDYAFSLDLPTATEQDLVVRANQTTVFVGTDGKLFFLEVPAGSPEAEQAAPREAASLSPEELEARLRELAVREPDAEISIKAQAETAYQRVVDVVNVARRAGLQRVVLPYQYVTPAAEGPPAAAPSP